MLERGFAGVSLDAIAAAAGVTKRTIYTRYESKVHLLHDVLRSVLHDITSSLRHDGQKGDAQQCLQRLAMHLLSHLLAQKCTAWMRLATTELINDARFSEVVRSLIDDGVDFVENALDTLHERGLWAARDKRLAARFFVSLIREPVLHWTYLGIPPPSKAEQKRYAQQVVAFFLAGCAGGGV